MVCWPMRAITGIKLQTPIQLMAAKYGKSDISFLPHIHKHLGYTFVYMHEKPKSIPITSPYAQINTKPMMLLSELCALRSRNGPWFSFSVACGGRNLPSVIGYRNRYRPRCI